MMLKKYGNKLLLLCMIFLMSGCHAALIDSKGTIGIEERTLIFIAAGLMLIVVIPVIVMTIAFARKYRASNKSAKYIPNWASSGKIEAVVWAVPCLIILALSIVTFYSTHKLDPRKVVGDPEKVITIEVISLDWKWLFIYPDQNIATVNEIAFPVNTPVEFRITSDSVMNSFFIPQLGSQIYAMAGMENRLHLIANQIGKYDGISSSYSGAGFSGMKFTANATSQEDFDKWVAQVKQSKQTLSQAAFDQLAKPSRDNPVEYFSSVKKGLYLDTIYKFMGNMNHHSKAHTSSRIED